MANIKDVDIGIKELNQYLDEQSDFCFELKILNLLRGFGVDCSHSGHYTDVVTGVAREYDIRAYLQSGLKHLRMAIECKNLKKNNPLLVMCTIRHDNECYNDILMGFGPEQGLPNGNLAPHRVTLTGNDSIYPRHAFSGKSLSQVGVKANNSNDILASSSEVYNKWSQCLSSSVDLIERSMWDYFDPDGDNAQTLSMILPILIVPDDTLWSVKFDNDGNKMNDPEKTNHVPMFVGKSFTVGNGIDGGRKITYRFSHIDIFTKSGFEEFIMKNHVYGGGEISLIDSQKSIDAWVADMY
ncbi:hypothetical protein [Shewanella algae]|uniref:hypothetical protein n=1 Tax=Shewanella algae TaxID=38313 RepID=UPI000F4259AA|nr:hypothetical protein [Shewanella algae]AYV12359.1 hypothetical protein EEY24_05355 [Shewanella algae]